MNVAVVSEGVNDFIAFRSIFLRVAEDKGHKVSRFDSIQPRVDATSGTQTGGGGWTRVKLWVENNRGEKAREIFAPKLFSMSVAYDVLIIHLDGDVVWLSRAFSAATRANCFQNSAAVASAVENFIESELQPPDDLDDRILYAVPVMHTECWLVAAAMESMPRLPLEHRKLKISGQRYLARKQKVAPKIAMSEAAKLVGANLAALRGSLPSLDHFARKVDAIL